MKTLVEDMLRQNRFLSADGVKKTRTDLSALVRREAEAYAPAARQKQITLSVKTEPALWIDCDAEMIAIAVRNFLSNAVKYAPAGERITVTAAKEGNKAAVRVKNTGSRIGKESILLFSRDMVASIVPESRRLRAVQKIELKPGQQQTVTFRLPAKDLAFVGTDGQWHLEPGAFKLQIGNQHCEVICVED